MKAQISVPELHTATYRYLPNVMQITGINDRALDNQIQHYIDEITGIDQYTVITKLHSIFSYINGAEKGDIKSQDLLSFYDQQAKLLFDFCQGHADWQRKIIGKLKQSILDNTHNDVANPNNPAYLNYMAEILYAAKILPEAMSGGYEFCGFDMPLGNGRDADLSFKRVEDGKMIYFDNISIHGVDISQVEKPNDLYDFLKRRIDVKTSDKTKGLCKSGDDYIINGVQSEFYVAPILWNETCDFLPYKDAFEKFAAELSLSKLFVALLPQQLPDGHYHFSIETILYILQRWEEQECFLKSFARKWNVKRLCKVIVDWLRNK